MASTTGCAEAMPLRIGEVVGGVICAKVYAHQLLFSAFSSFQESYLVSRAFPVRTTAAEWTGGTTGF